MEALLTNDMKMDIDKLNKTVLCYAETIYRINGLWEGPDPLSPLISLFLVQLTVSMSFIHLVVFLFKPLNQPPFIAEILGGIFLGPSVLGRVSSYRKFLFPSYSFRILEPMAHFSITLYAFLIGLKMDIKAITRAGPKPTRIALTGMIIPFLVGSCLYFVFDADFRGFIFWGSALTVTGFSVLTNILGRLQILHTETGKTAAVAALISDVSGWGFLALSFTLSGSFKAMFLSIICTVGYVFICIYAVRPALGRIIQKKQEGQGYSEFYICTIVCAMALSGVVTDLFGTHPMIGALVFGLVIPNEVLEATIVDKLEDFVSGILLPIFVVVCGLRTNVDVLTSNSSWIVVAFVILIACGLKVFSCLVATFFTDMTIDEAIEIGLLSSTKSIMVLIILESGQIQGVLDTQVYSLMVIAVLVMTAVVTPLAGWYKPAQNASPYNRRTIQKGKMDEELRVLACIYDMSNVHTLINILTTSNASEKSPIAAFALQLVELVGRATTTTVVVHNSPKPGHRNPSSVEAQADQIITAFNNYELRSEGVSTQVITARCSYNTMDTDVCALAKEKQATLIIIPFHRQITQDGEMEDINASIRGVNEGILERAPCSVGILVDKGFAETKTYAANIAVLYFGGPDDREALAYAWRMASSGENTDTKLTVVRFLSNSDSYGMARDELDASHMSLNIDYEQEKILDDDYLNTFKSATKNNDAISYRELVLQDEEETIKAIKSMDEHQHDLYMVGRGRGIVSPLTSGLADWCECPELGPIGDLLITSEFESKFSVLIVQQYLKPKGREGSMRSASSVKYGDEAPIRHSMSDSDAFESLGSFRKWSHDD